MKTRLAVAALLCGMLSFPLNAKDVCLQGTDDTDTIQLKFNGLHFKKGATSTFTGIASIYSGAYGVRNSDLISGVYYVFPDGKSATFRWTRSPADSAFGRIEGTVYLPLPAAVGSLDGNLSYNSDDPVISGAFPLTVFDCKTFAGFTVPK